MKITVRDIAQQLAGRADVFCRWLLPSGRLDGGAWVVGSVAGEAGRSCRVTLSGQRAGRWRDYAGGEQERGDLIDLLRMARGLTIGQAIKEAKEWLGIAEPRNSVPPRAYSRPNQQGCRTLSETSPVVEYLVNQRRLDFFSRDAFGVAESTHPEHGPEIAFPYYAPDKTTLVNIKRIALKRTAEGKKIVRQERGCAPCLFGWRALDPEARSVVITEGELDAITWHQAGFPALSVPDGAGGTTWIDYEWENLERFDTIYLNWDGDVEGQKHVAAFARRLGLARCLVVRLADGYKDANEALQAGRDAAWFLAALDSARPLTPEQIKEPVNFLEKVVEKFYPKDGIEPGFQSFLMRKIRFRPGEVTLWTGVSGHGKSAILGQLMLEAIQQGEKVAIASMEMKGEATLFRILCQSIRANPVPEGSIAPALRWMGGKLWIYDLLGNVEPQLLLDLMEYSFSRSGVNMFVIDSLMKCMVESDDYEAQRIFMNRVCSFAKDTNTHIHLIAHPRKGNSEESKPGKLDVKGSSDLTSQPDNVLCVFRNKDKESRAQSNQGTSETEPDTIVTCSKQRETGEEFAQYLRHMRGIYRFARMDVEDTMDLNILNRIREEEASAGVESELPLEAEEPQGQEEDQGARQSVEEPY